MSTAGFTEALLHWHATDNDRSLPWKEEKDAYRIWLSEIILQQTRAAQGLPYYLRFVEAYPSIKDLAAAPDEEVFRLWQGLGYYSRCKNMLATARFVVQELNGVFPQTAAGIAQLKGIGPYTAAAIASFAFGEAVAVVDGNVYRVLARYFGIQTAYDTTGGRKEFTRLAGQLLKKEESAAYNQAIMDLGATVCTPKAARCGTCPLQNGCGAYRQNMVHLLPVKSKTLTVHTRYFNYVLLHAGDKFWFRKRMERDIWENLYQPWLLETAGPVEKSDILHDIEALTLYTPVLHYAGKSSQRLTHRIIKATFYIAELTKEIALPEGNWYRADELNSLAFPKTVNDFLVTNNIIKNS